MEEKNTKKMLYIPSGVEARKMFLPGYGTKELGQSFFIALVLLPIVAATLLFTKRTDYVMFSLLGIMAFAFSFCLKKDGISIFETAKKAVLFHKTQKWYAYRVYKEFWEEME